MHFLPISPKEGAPLRRDEVLKLYRRVEKTDPVTGKTTREAVYIGPLYDVPDCDFSGARRRAFLCWCAGAAGILGGGFVPSASTHTAWVLLPYLASMAALCFCASGLWMLRGVNPPLNEMQRQEGLERLKSWSLALLIFSGVWFVGQAVFLIRFLPYAKLGGDGLFTLFSALTAGAALTLWLSMRKLRAEKVSRADLAAEKESDADEP